MDQTDLLKHLALIGAGVFFTFLSFFYLLKKEPLPKKNIPGIKWPKNTQTALKAYIKGASLIVFAFPPVFLTAQLLSLVTAYFFPEYKNEQIVVSLLRDLRTSPLIYAFMTLYLVLIVPFFEELVFRGFLQMALKTVFGVKISIVATSLIFALFHYSSLQGISNIELLSALFVFSCFLCYFHEKGNSIFIPIGLHSIFNLINIILVSLT